jgi:hypothetical protein
MPTHKWTNTLNRGGAGTHPAQTATLTGDGENVRSLTIPASTTNQQIIIAFAIAAMKSIFIKASGACTLKTNSSGAPDDTFSLDADSGVMWHNQMSAANPITANVTTMYITTPSGDPVDLEIYVLVDATP